MPHLLTQHTSFGTFIRRKQLTARTGGTFQVPYLVDPNTGTELFESTAIVKYLEQVYTV
jgi:glutathione S-transferase